MTAQPVRTYLFTCFWLAVPVLLFDALFTERLPPAFQMESFWRDIPAVIAIPENVFRIGLFGFMLLMPIELGTRRARIGLAVYLAGMAAYLGAWLMLICAPQSGWSASLAGSMAPAYTPAIWLAGIGMVGTRLSIRRIPFHPWGYAACAASFLICHNAHSFLVLTRTD